MSSQVSHRKLLRVLGVVFGVAMLAALLFEDPLHSLGGFAFLALVGATYAIVIRTKKE
ncbi:MAG TPA: hypothetical protein VF042_16440 [Gemmatimonadaceae bacterium]